MLPWIKIWRTVIFLVSALVISASAWQRPPKPYWTKEPYKSQDGIPQPSEPAAARVAPPVINFKPFAARVLNMTVVDEDNKLRIGRAAMYVIDRLSKVIKTDGLTDVRLSMDFDVTTDKCKPATCEGRPIPGE